MPEAKLKTGINVVKVQVVTGYNTDRKDLIAGGDHVLGPYMWVLDEHKDEFVRRVKEILSTKAKPCHVYGVEASEERFIRANKVPTLEEQIAGFESYLSERKNWGC